MARLAALASNYTTDRDIDRALLLSVESYHAVDGVQGLEPPVAARSAALGVLQHEPFLAGILTLPIPTVYNCAIVASGRYEELLEVILWDGKTRQLIGTLYTSDAWNEVGGNLDGAYGLRMVGNDKAQVCHVARDPLLADTPMSKRLILVTLQLDEQKWLDQACWTAGRNLSLEEWERYFGDVPYQATCSQWPAGN